MNLLTTNRLVLRPFTRGELESQSVSHGALGATLAQTRLAHDWPNEHWDANAVRWLREKLDAFPNEPFWRPWLICLREGGTLTAVGTIGYKGPPDGDGIVEIGYGVVRSRWRRGIATEAVSTLLAWAVHDPRVRGVRAHTLHAEPASSGVLRKNGFAFIQTAIDPDEPEIGPIDRFEISSFHIRLRAVVDQYWRRFGDHAQRGEPPDVGPRVSWCGFYRKVPDAEEMVLVHREPKPACSPIGLHGMCGRGWREQKSFVVPDIRVLGEHYVACDPRDMSELVVPVYESAAHRARGECWGVFDADSYQLHGFSARDCPGVHVLLRAWGLLQGEQDPAVLVIEG